MFDQLIIGDKYSYDDFEASVKERRINAPKKKVIKETVPFSNKTHDFSGINGEIYWEERTLEYVFEIVATTPEMLEEYKTAFSSWVMNVVEEKIYDPYIAGYHFIGTFDNISYDDDEGVEKTTITVTFTAYPYKIANVQTEHIFELAANVEIAAKVINNSSHRITPTITSDVEVIITLGNASYAIPAGETTDDSFKLSAGVNDMTIKASSSGNLTIGFYCEVF